MGNISMSLNLALNSGPHLQTDNYCSQRKSEGLQVLKELYI